MIWGPFLLALALGIIVSAGLYFAYLWPQVEPDDEADDEMAAQAPSPAGTTPARSAAAPQTSDPGHESSPA